MTRKPLKVYREEAASAVDRAFFKSRPERRHRVRESHPDEIAAAAAAFGVEMKCPCEMAWFTLVKAIGPKLQIKTFTCFWEDAPTDLTEKEARRIWEITAKAITKTGR